MERNLYDEKRACVFSGTQGKPRDYNLPFVHSNYFVQLKYRFSPPSQYNRPSPISTAHVYIYI